MVTCREYGLGVNVRDDGIYRLFLFFNEADNESYAFSTGHDYLKPVHLPAWWAHSW